MSFFHQNIKTIRRAWKISQDDAGKVFGISQSAYQKWEDDAEPDYDTLIKVAAYYKVSIKSLLETEIQLGDVPKRFQAYKELPETTDGDKLEEPAVSQIKGVATLVDVSSLINEVSELRERLEKLEGK